MRMEEPEVLLKPEQRQSVLFSYSYIYPLWHPSHLEGSQGLCNHIVCYLHLEIAK